jgi:hypothetical protein
MFEVPLQGLPEVSVACREFVEHVLQKVVYVIGAELQDPRD